MTMSTRREFSVVIVSHQSSGNFCRSFAVLQDFVVFFCSTSPHVANNGSLSDGISVCLIKMLHCFNCTFQTDVTIYNEKKDVFFKFSACLFGVFVSR